MPPMEVAEAMNPDLSLCYSIRCRNCRYSRTFGYARITAEARAISHALRMSHIVDITVTDLTKLCIVSKTSVPSNVMTLPEEAPF